MKENLLIILFCILNVSAQVCVKKGLLINGGFWLPQISLLENIINWMTSSIIILGIFIYIISTFIFMYLIDRLDFTYFYPWTSLTYIFAFIAGILIFKEKVSVQGVLGTTIILIGVVILSKS